MTQRTTGTPSAAELIYDWNTHNQRQPKKPVTLDDETLRDGLQSPSITTPTIEQKIELLHLMAALGIERANIGLPGAGPHVVRDVTRIAREIVDQKLPIQPNCAARTVVADIEPIADIAQDVGAKLEAAMFLGSSPIRRYTEDWDMDRLLRCTEEAVRFAVDHGLDAMYVTEDTTRSDPETLSRLYKTAIECGARRIVICDTVGHATPVGVRALIRFALKLVDSTGEPVKVDWHGHNDRGLGLTNALSAIVAGADSVHGCGLGIGERCGNTSMDQLLVNLHLLGWRTGDLGRLTEYCHKVSEYCQVPIPSNYPVVGSDAFETGTGVHAAAVIKAYRKGDHWLANRVYSGVPADDFGLEQKILVGPMCGRSNVVWVLKRLGLPTDDQTIDRVFQTAKRSRTNLTDEEVRHAATPHERVDEWHHFEMV